LFTIFLCFSFLLTITIIHPVFVFILIQAWAKDQGTGGTIIKMFSDPNSEFTRACNMELTADGPRSKGLLGRSKRFAMIVENNIITAMAVAEAESDPAGDDFPEKTLAPALIKMATIEMAAKK
jgi:peroxiredoxin